MTKEILDGNKLIAEFTGWKIVTEKLSELYPDHIRIKAISPDGSCVESTPSTADYSEEKLWYNLTNTDYGRVGKYNSSYDKLMPVCKKIYELGYDVGINSNLRRIIVYRNDNGLMKKAPMYGAEFRGNKSMHKDKTDIECLFFAIVEFIEWHNENNKLKKTLV